jgi:hypothetical protein
MLGNDAVVDKIRITTNRWIEEGRYKMAEHGVGRWHYKEVIKHYDG